MSIEKYVLVEWPDSQFFMAHERCNDCYRLVAFPWQRNFDSAYFVPQEMYKELDERIDKGSYMLAEWPYSQLFMEHDRFDECYLVHAHQEQRYYDSSYFIPEDLYDLFRPDLDGFDETTDRHYGRK